MKTDKWKCPSCGRADTEPMYNICECGTELERVTCLQPAEGELVEMQCPVAKECEKATGMGCTSECLFVRGWEALLRGREAQRHCDLQHMVEIDWLFERCPHSEPLMLATRRECDECMDELLKREAK